MEDPNSTLLPYILETLSRKPELCDTFDNLCKEIEAQLVLDNNTRYGNVRNALQRALNVGQSLGIITLTNETIRVPFNFRANPKNAKAAPNATSSPVPQPAIGTGNQPVQQNTDRSPAPKQRKMKKNKSYESREVDPEFIILPSTRRKPMRARPRGRYARKTGVRSNSRGRAGRGRARGRAYGRRTSRRR